MRSTSTPGTPPPPEDGRLLRGRRTRQALLERAADLASVEGLEGVTIARLAADLEVSKSGVFAHFSSKEELQLAAVETAREVYVAQVVTPALAAPRGLPRAWEACRLRIEYMRTAFSGGCFFYAVGAEFDAKPGRVRDRLAEVRGQWVDWLTGQLTAARDSGQLRPDVDVADLAFAVDSYALTANGDARLRGDDALLDVAARLTLRALRDAAADPSLLPERVRRRKR